MDLGKTNPKFEYVMRLKNDELVVINKCTDEKDLGVIFDYKLSFDAHIQNAINRANRMLGIICRTFTFLNKITLLNLYKALVRPHLEYGNEIWFPLLKRQSAAIEKVQRRTTKFLREVYTLNYKAPSLKYRRLRGDMITVYKLLNGLVEIDWQTFFTLSKSDKTRGSHRKLYIKYSKTSIRKNAFSNRAVPIWNFIFILLIII